MKAMMVYNYQMLASNKGTVLGTDIPSVDAWYIALFGAQPGEQDEISAIMAYKKDKRKQVDEAAKFIVDHRTRWVHQPDERPEIESQINAYIRLLDPDIRMEALKRAQNTTPRGLLESLSEQMEKERAEAEMIKKYGKSN